MLRIIILILFIKIGPFLCQKDPTIDFSAQKIAVENLIERLINDKANLFNVTIQNILSQERDGFTLEKLNNQIHIIGTSGVAAAYGFHYYLKNYCNCHISWDSDQLKLPAVLPDVKIKITSMDKFRYYQNVCTYSYSYTWWKWERWEREIDWMALNGINLALTFTGQEAIWSKVFKHFNLTSDEIAEHFTGPAFLAWGRMGNIRGWGGPLSESWHINSLALQHKILKRMRELGIIPVLPAFCGHLPRAFKRLYPKVEMKKLEPWATFSNKYCCPYLLSSKEMLFTVIGEMFLTEIVKEFGITHYYNCDTFNELANPFEGIYNLSIVSSSVIESILKVDPNGIWILQGWTFADNQTYWTTEKVREYLSGVPNDKMIILDLQSETVPQYTRLESYFGKPFIWCMLHNFGGNLGMHGSFDILNERIIEARIMKNSTMIGTGVTPEGINQNYVIYDFMLESSWRNITVDTNLWIEKYSERRYGLNNQDLKNAWKILKNGIYNYKLPIRLHGNYTLCVRPKLTLEPWRWYNLEDVWTVWDLFANASDTIKPDKIPENLKYDLIDINRQALQLIFDEVYKNVIHSYFNKDLKSLLTSTQTLLAILRDLDFLLSTNINFMLGPWLESAKSWAHSLEEKKRLVFFAKNQITLWGPKGEIIDYGTKQWNGVVFDYYYPRWQLFCDYLFHCLTTGSKFNQKKFNKDVFERVEVPFCGNTINYLNETVKDAQSVAKIVYKKWRSYIRL